jgi:hypothetical protein
MTVAYVDGMMDPKAKRDITRKEMIKWSVLMFGYVIASPSIWLV